MISFKASISIAADADKVYSIISDPARIPEFWHGTRIVVPQGKLYRVKFAFPAWGVMEFNASSADLTVHTNYISGPVRGRKVDIVVSREAGCEMTTEWNVSLALYLRPFQRRIADHFETGARHALERIKQEAENKK